MSYDVKLRINWIPESIDIATKIKALALVGCYKYCRIYPVISSIVFVNLFLVVPIGRLVSYATNAPFLSPRAFFSSAHVGLVNWRN